jgi:hypothetical protein
VLWLNPLNVDAFPEGLLDALDDADLVAELKLSQPDHSIEGRLKARMQADALQPVVSLEDDETSTAAPKETLRKTPYSEEDLKEVVQFLQLTVCFDVCQTVWLVVWLNGQLSGKGSAGACFGLSEAQVHVLLLVWNGIRWTRRHGRELPWRGRGGARLKGKIYTVLIYFWSENACTEGV